MLKIDGIQPKLDGHICDELICQQYLYKGKLQNEVDVLSIKADGRWHQLYFEEGTVFWRTITEEPQPFEPKPGDVFEYPFVDIGEQYQLKNKLITDLIVEAFPDGAKVSIEFEQSRVLTIYHQDNRNDIRFTAHQ